MKKFKKITIFIILIITFFIGYKINQTKTLNINNKDYKLYLDGKSASSFPPPGDYSVKVECQNGTGYWNYDAWNLVINNISIHTSCSVYFSKINNKIKLSDYIISLANTNQGNGKIIHETFLDNDTTIDAGYRYAGQNPNNFVKFNNELWRIIGVFETKLASGETQFLTKIIREDALGGFVYNSQNMNTWNNTSGTKAYLNQLLNNYYYTSTNGTSSEACLGAINTTDNIKIKTSCNWTDTGIKENYRPMIENVIWNLGGMSSKENAENYYQKNTSEWYKYEKNSNSSSSVSGHVGLIYPSDYGFAVLSSSCDRTTNLTSYSSTSCAGNNWLYRNGAEWTIMTDTGSINNAFIIGESGKISSASIVDGYIARPTVYLNQNVYITSGEGNRNNPYIIKI